MKILTAWTCAKPVVSTSIGAEGLPYADNIDLAIADSPLDFSKKIIRLLRNPELRRQMGEAGHRNVMHNFSPDKVISEIMTCYKETINQKLSR